MITFAEYQNIAANVPIASRNDRDRVELPVLGLQEETGKLGKLLSVAFASGKFHLTSAQSSEAKDRMADILWCIARLCVERAFRWRPLLRIAPRSSKHEPGSLIRTADKAGVSGKRSFGADTGMAAEQFKIVNVDTNEELASVGA